MTVPAVQATELTKTFGDVVALDAVDLTLPAGQVHGLVGPNGAGKTTLMGLLLGLATADSGHLEILGAPVGQVLGVPEGVAGFVDAPGLYPSLTARQNLTALASLRGRSQTRGAVDDALEQVGLTDVADDRLRGFSLGMRQRLGLAAALLTQPRLLVLDEPANGLDPAGKHHVHEVLRDLARRGTAVLVSSHHMDDVASQCSAVTILASGRVAFSGPVAHLATLGDVVDYRLVTSDPSATRRLVEEHPGLRLDGAATQARGDGALVVFGPQDAVDDLVRDLVAQRVSLREIGPVVPPLEAAFLALTTTPDDPGALDEPDDPEDPSSLTGGAGASRLEDVHAGATAGAGR